MIFLCIVNAVVAAGSGFFAILAALRPSALITECAEGAGVLFYARMYAAKAVPLCVLAAVIPFLATGPVAGLCLLGAALSQALDAAIGLGRRDVRQAAGGTVAAVVHTLVAVLVL
ncbi:hypothetical protein [Streptomyces sp. NRRL F-5126]|uniref:hypothetical protein n=1 Tax=Streptomyces sp. NRRL F-5126 TaxID=1463857 RepID=UPI000690A0F3|nr:hypothetical protein [Streptomyces sp. NRRL F-5126]